MSNGFKVSHIGLMVSDLERATKFYVDGMGFTLIRTATLGKELAEVMGIGGDISMTTRILELGGTTIELLFQGAPKLDLPQPRRQIGLYHLCLAVEDMDASSARVQEYGGVIEESSRVRLDRNTSPELAFVPEGEFFEVVKGRDTEGTPLELTAHPVSFR